MKFSFKMDVKGIPTASVSIDIEGTNDEIITFISSDPVYQEFSKKLIEEVSCRNVSHSNEAQLDELDRRLDALLKS